MTIEASKGLPEFLLSKKQIAFNSGFTPRQLFRDDEVLNAAKGLNPEITLTMTGEVYYCPLIGKK